MRVVCHCGGLGGDVVRGLVEPEGGGDALGGRACEAPLLRREDEILDIAILVSDAVAAAFDNGLDPAGVVLAVERPPDLNFVADLDVVE